MKRGTKRALTSHAFLATALVLAVLVGNMAEPQILMRPEWGALDRLQRLRASDDSPPVVLVEIDAPSLERFGSWPWPRARAAELVRVLGEAAPAAIGLDLCAAGEENHPALPPAQELARQWPSGGDEALRARLEETLRQLDGTALLARAAEEARVVLALRSRETDAQGLRPVPPSGASGSGFPWPPEASPEDHLRRLRNPWPLWAEAEQGSREIIFPPDLLLEAAWGIGHRSLPADGDGTVRRLPLLLSGEEAAYPALSLAVALAAGGHPLSSVQLHGPLDEFTGVQWAGGRVPTDGAFHMLIDYAGSRRAVMRLSAADVLAGQIPPETFRGGLVLIGPTDPEATPLYSTPLGERVSGVEIAAAALADLAGGAPLLRPPWSFALETALLLYLALFLLVILPRTHLRSAFLILAVFVLTWGGVAGYLLVREGWWLKVVPFTALAACGFCLLVLRAWRRSGGGDKRDELNRTLGLTYQGQGMLDLAFEKFLRCPVGDPAVRELLYNLGLDFERKRMPAKAASVYRHMLQAGAFRDIPKRIERLEGLEQTVVLGTGGGPVPLNAGGIPPTLGRYEILGVLGQGAMGTVYRGNDPRIHREVAIKTLPLSGWEEAEEREVKKRFFREAEAAGRLSHPHIVTLYDAGEDGDIAYLAMEVLTGSDLGGYCRPGNLLPPAEVLRIVEAVAMALDYAHRHDVVHRDIKPSNIMRAPDGGVKVTDFGIARILSAAETQTRTGTVMGTPHYMSPEQVSGKKVDGRSDLFSLGAVAFELLSGTKAFQGESLPALMYAVSQARHLPLREAAPGVPPCCASLVEKLLSRGVTRRFRSAAEVAEAARRCRESLK